VIAGANMSCCIDTEQAQISCHDMENDNTQSEQATNFCKCSKCIQNIAFNIEPLISEPNHGSNKFLRSNSASFPDIFYKITAPPKIS